MQGKETDRSSQMSKKFTFGVSRKDSYYFLERCFASLMEEEGRLNAGKGGGHELSSVKEIPFVGSRKNITRVCLFF